VHAMAFPNRANRMLEAIRRVNEPVRDWMKPSRIDGKSVCDRRQFFDSDYVVTHRTITSASSFLPPGRAEPWRPARTDLHTPCAICVSDPVSLFAISFPFNDFSLVYAKSSINIRPHVNDAIESPDLAAIRIMSLLCFR
jgi:hypothetical protein